MSETWRDVPGFDGLYEVSSMGRVRSWKIQGNTTRKAAKPRITKLKQDRYGYNVAVLKKDGKNMHLKVPRLVLEVFVGPADDRQACHNNGQRTDDRLENLRWDTVAANAADRKKHGTQIYGTQAYNAKLTEEDVRWARSVFVRRHPEFGSVALARELGVSQSVMHAALTGKSWKHIT